jgi:hypothetical protein
MTSYPSVLNPCRLRCNIRNEHMPWSMGNRQFRPRSQNCLLRGDAASPIDRNLIVGHFYRHSVIRRRQIINSYFHWIALMKRHAVAHWIMSVNFGGLFGVRGGEGAHGKHQGARKFTGWIGGNVGGVHGHKPGLLNMGQRQHRSGKSFFCGERASQQKTSQGHLAKGPAHRSARQLACRL